MNQGTPRKQKGPRVVERATGGTPRWNKGGAGPGARRFTYTLLQPTLLERGAAEAGATNLAPELSNAQRVYRYRCRAAMLARTTGATLTAIIRSFREAQKVGPCLRWHGGSPMSGAQYISYGECLSGKE